MLSFIYGGLSGFLGLLVSDYADSLGNKDQSDNDIIMATNYNTTTASYNNSGSGSINDILSIDYHNHIVDNDTPITTENIVNNHDIIISNIDFDPQRHNYSNHNHHHNEVASSSLPVIIHSMKSYQQHMLEGGILFATFEIVAYLLEIIVPEQFNLKFSFNQFLQLVEKDLDPTIPIDM